MKNQFFYTRKENVPSSDTTSSALEVKTYRESFNVDKVIRTVTSGDGGMVVLLDDIHDRITQVPALNNRGKITGYRNEKGTFQSEIYLDKEDADRFMNLSSVEL